MARRILNRKDLRADYEAAERRKDEEEVSDEEEEGDEDEEEDGPEEDAEEGVSEDDDEEAPTPRKRKPAKEPKAKAKTKPRSRSSKVTRMKVVWGVFNNSNQRVAVYEYPKRKEADDHAARLTADKKSTHFVQPVKEPIEEKKESS